MTTTRLSATRLVYGVTIQPAKPGDARAILDLIRSVNLPCEGLEAALEYFWVAREGESIVGSVGFEVYNPKVSGVASPDRVGVRSLGDMACGNVPVPPAAAPFRHGGRRRHRQSAMCGRDVPGSQDVASGHRP